MSSAKHEAFIQACRDKNYVMASTLVDDGLDLEFRDREGRYPMHYAAALCFPEAVDLLIRKGANIECRDHNGNTPLSDAVFHGQGRTEVIQKLLECGANPEANNHHGISPKSLASTIANYDYSDLFQ